MSDSGSGLASENTAAALRASFMVLSPGMWEAEIGRPGLMPSLSAVLLGWRMECAPFSACSPRSRTTDCEDHARWRPPLRATTEVIAANRIFSRRSPRKMISVVSSRALPANHFPPDFARHGISRPIVSLFLAPRRIVLCDAVCQWAKRSPVLPARERGFVWRAGFCARWFGGGLCPVQLEFGCQFQ